MSEDTEKKPRVTRVEVGETTLRRGDILLVRSKGIVGKIILAAQGSTDKDAPTHTAVIIADDPVLVLEVVSPRVRVLPLRESLKGVEVAHAFRIEGDDPERHLEALRLACMADGSSYGYWGVFKLGCRYVFKRVPGESAQLWFRLIFGLLIPFLFPILAAFRLREIALGTWFLALTEGFFLVFLGFRLVDGLHYHTALITWLVRYFWVGWVIYLELLAWDYGDTSALRRHGIDAAASSASRKGVSAATQE